MPWIEPVPGETPEEIAQRATALAQRACPEGDVSVFFDEVWGWRIGASRIPDPELLTREEPDWRKRVATTAKYLRDADDYWFHVYRPKEGDTIVDIGAGRGEDVYAFSKAVGPTGRVWAIEPHPTSFLALRKLCEWNGLANVTLVNAACVDREGVSLQIETMPVWESNYVREGAPSPTSHAVDGTTFDRLSERLGIGAIDFLKMNIEGAERFALPGCREALRRTRMLCISGHDFRANRGEGEEFRTLAFVREELTRAGFTLITRDEDPRYYVPYHVHGIAPGQ